jgi:hypothetical protein
MIYDFFVTQNFKQETKRLLKKYPSLISDLQEFRNEYSNFSGVDLGNGFRKIRLRIKSKGVGKSGGGRIITKHIDIVVSEEGKEVQTIVLVDIYDKSERESISESRYNQIFEEYIKSLQ